MLTAAATLVNPGGKARSGGLGHCQCFGIKSSLYILALLGFLASAYSVRPFVFSAGDLAEGKMPVPEFLSLHA